MSILQYYSTLINEKREMIEIERKKFKANLKYSSDD